jgi:hypothetical protein
VPFVFLLIVPWLGVRAAIVMALVLLPVIAVACRKLCAANQVAHGPSTRRTES